MYDQLNHKIRVERRATYYVGTHGHFLSGGCEVHGDNYVWVGWRIYLQESLCYNIYAAN
jgi:hypothetical protein